MRVNMFVAGFIGSPQINFIRGKLEGETFVCGENRLRLAPWAAHKLEAWSSKEVILGLHPEVFSLAEEAGDGTFKADFVAKEFMGSHLIIHAQIQQQDVQCRIDDTSACFGGRLYLKPDMSRAHFFDAETGEAILHMEAGDDHA
jgi:multiple sugar transport system ATP-binding protein